MNWIKSNRLLIQTIVFIGIFFFIVTRIPKEIDWSPSFSHFDERPYGSKILYDRLPDIFTQEISLEDNSLYEMLKLDSSWLDDESKNMLIISSEFFIDSAELKLVLDYVDQGNDLFISSGLISYTLLDTLGLKREYNTSFSGISDISYDISFYDEGKNADSSFLFKASNEPFDIVSSKEINDASAISYLDRTSDLNGKAPIHIKKPFGKGNFYLHSFPYAFTNYHILKQPDEDYIAKSLAYMPDRATIWNAYYKPGAGKANQDSLHVIANFKGTKWAYYLLLGGVLFYAIFNLKRKQRIIPIIEAPRNIREDYIKTIGNLHLEENTNRAMFDKKVKFFKDYLLRVLGVRDLDFSKESSLYIAQRTGKDPEVVDKLFNNIRGIQSGVPVSDARLERLTNNINYIYGHTDAPIQNIITDGRK